MWVRGCHSTQGRPPVPAAGWEGVGSGSSSGSLASCSVDWVQEAGTRPSLDSYSSSRSGHQNQDTPPRAPSSGESLTPNGHVIRVCLAKEPGSSLLPLKYIHNLNKLWGVTHTLEMKILLEFPVCTASFGRHRFGTPHLL